VQYATVHFYADGPADPVSRGVLCLERFCPDKTAQGYSYERCHRLVDH
jgi:hypothetical protein